LKSVNDPPGSQSSCHATDMHCNQLGYKGRLAVAPCHQANACMYSCHR